MAEYTNFFEDKSFDIPYEDDYIEEMKSAVKLFRTFDKALDTFILEHGFKGDIDNVDEKVSYISDKMKSAGVPIPRNIRKWYTEHKRIERNSKTPFQICFAFGLSVEEVNDFLRRICLSRGLDPHSVEEVVYYFAFKNELGYSDAMGIIEQVEKVKPSRINVDEVIYTDLIADEIDEIETVEELISYLNENSCRFEYNNATACNIIKNIWKSITEEDGIACREKKILYAAFDEDKEEKPDDKKAKKNISAAKDKGVKKSEESIWKVYLQILGLSGDYMKGICKDRSLKSILKDGELLHPLAEESFPDREGLNKILIGEHVSYERVRKVLILLVFYRFWAVRAIEKKEYKAGYGDTDRCIAAINDSMVEAGYPLLYAANPYDFCNCSEPTSKTGVFSVWRIRQIYFYS